MESFELKNKKYEIIKTNLDEYKLKYKDKEITFKSDINTTKRIQSAISDAKAKVVIDLAKNGLSIKNLVIEEKIGGKIFVDNTNKNELENIYIEKEMASVFDDLCKEKLGLGLTELILDIELDEKDQEKFAEELGGAFIGKMP